MLVTHVFAITAGQPVTTNIRISRRGFQSTRARLKSAIQRVTEFHEIAYLNKNTIQFSPARVLCAPSKTRDTG